MILEGRNVRIKIAASPFCKQKNRMKADARAAKNKRALFDLLDRQCFVTRGSAHTHTSMGDPTGSFYVTGSNVELFFKLYKAALDSGAHLHFT